MIYSYFRQEKLEGRKKKPRQTQSIKNSTFPKYLGRNDIANQLLTVFSDNSHFCALTLNCCLQPSASGNSLVLVNPNVRIDRSIMVYSYLHFQQLPGGTDSLIELTSDIFIHLPFFTSGPIKLIQHRHLLFSEVSLPSRVSGYVFVCWRVLPLYDLVPVPTVWSFLFFMLLSQFKRFHSSI